jgi:predicted transcriptional regulator
MLEQLYVTSEQRRDKIQIYYDILKVSAQPVKITRLMRLANIQYNAFIDCTETLLKAGFLEKVNFRTRKKRSKTKELFKATRIGLDWCRQVEEIYNSLHI